MEQLAPMNTEAARFSIAGHARLLPQDTSRIVSGSGDCRMAVVGPFAFF
jgi:hypothetical protein